MNKKQIEKEFKKAKKRMVELIGHNNTTFDGELDVVGKKLFGRKFRGVFPSDKIPTLKESEMAILNLDESDEPGTHWVAVYKNDREILIYDSFGRDTYRIIPSLKGSGNGKISAAENDAEQSEDETNCGQWCLAFLYMVDKYCKEDVARFL